VALATMSEAHRLDKLLRVGTISIIFVDIGGEIPGI
jgi:hypothetical protein